MNAIVVKTNDATQTISQIEIITKDGTPTVIKAVDKVNYEFHDKSINRAPNHIVTKRIKNDLHVSFEKEGKDSDLIIEGFYDSADSALVGIAEDGEYYYYIPDTGETYDYVTQLNIGDVEGQALGGQEYVAAAIPWWIPAAAGIGLVGLLASGSSNSRDDDSNTEEGTAPLVTDDRQTGTLGQPVVIDVLGNDTDLEGDIDPTTVKLINPDTGLEVTSLTIAGEGEWSVDPTTGAVTFTPEAGFTADPTPVNYVVSDVTGNKSNQATITVDYPPTAPNAEDEIQTGTLGQPVVIDVLSNDTDLEGDIDPTTVKLINPDTGLEVTSLTIAGEGVWSVDPTTGAVTFTPETGFTADPTPVNYVVSDVTGNKSNQATITVDYPPTAPNAEDEIQTGTLGQPVVIDVLSNDTDLEGDIDPTTVKLINPDTGLEVTSLTVAGEGVWSVDPTTGAVTFTPETGFTADPTPVNYVVSDVTGNKSNQATITVDYPPTAPNAEDEIQTGTLGQPVVIDVLGNDTDLEGDIDPTTVKLINPDTGLEVTSLTIAGEGEWSVDPTTGAVTFTPEAGFTADPTPVNYVVSDVTGNKSNQATITVDYPPTAPNAEDEIQTGTLGQPVVIDVLSNDTDLEGDIDPTTVKLINPDTGLEVTSLTVAGEGVWSVDPTTGAVTFTPETGFTADPTPVNYVVSDVTGNKSNQATITVDYPPTAPNAEDEIQTGTLGQPVVIDVLGNDTDLEGDIDPTTVKLINPDTGLEVTSLTIAGEGEWSVDPTTGAVTFTPEAGFTADPTPISYTVDDATGLTSNEATVTIDYPQTAPVAENDSESGTSGSPVVVDVVGNDSDPENDLDPTTVIITASPAGGTIAADGKSVVVSGEGTWSVDAATGEITFTPEAGFTADPTPISYTVDDATGLTSNEATVTIDYPQTAPVAENDSESGTSGSPVVVDVVGNDSDPENDLDPTTVIITQAPAGGTIAADGKSVVVSGEGTWSVDAATGEITFTPEAGFTADPTPISYTVDDVTGLTSNEATVTIDYPQTAPVAENDSESGTSGSPVVVDVVGNDSDPENDLDPTTVIITQAPAGGTIAADGKSVVVSGEGTWSVDAATGEITFTPEAGFTADPTPISYTVDDATGLTSNEATVTIDYPQTAPVAENDSESGTSGSPVVVDVVGNDSDPENDLDPTTVIITQAPAGGTIAADGKSVVVSGEGTWSVDAATGEITFTPEAGFTADPTPISYTVDDATGLTSNEATVTIDYPQTAPVAENDSESGTSGSPVVVDVVGNDSDPENDLDPTTVIITASPAGGTIAADGKSVVVSGEGTWSVDAATGEITFTPEAGFTADPTPISYTVDDATGLTSNEATVTINYPQTAPVAENDSESGTSGSPVVVDVVGNDSDPENDLDPTTVIITQAPAGGTIAADGKSVVVSGEGTWSVDAATGEITFTPEAGFTADPTPISYTVDDATGLTSNEATVTINYPQAVNDTQTGTSGSPVVVAVVGNDGQADNLDPATVIITASPAGGTIAVDGKSVVVSGEGTWSVDAATGEITFTPEAGFTADPTPISYTVDDATGLTSNEATVTIDYPQTAPVAENDSESGTSGSPVVVDVVGNDSDPENDLDPATVIITASPAGGTIATDGKSVVVSGEGTWSVDAATGEITFTPEAGFTADPTPISYTVDDATGLTSNEATVTIDYPQTAPVAENDSESGTSGSPVVVDVVGNDSDPENDLDPATVIITASPAGGTIATDGKSVVVSGEGTWSVDAATGEITFTPEAGFTADPTPISYTVDDATGLTSNEATVTIDYPQTAPVAENDSESGTSGSPVVVDVVGNDSDPENDLDPATVIITASPAGGTIATDGKSVVVSGEGTWSVDAATGEITFTPEAGFTADPTPISYTVDDATGLTSNEATVTIDYPQTAPVAENDSESGTSGSPVVVDVVGNDSDPENDLDPTTVIITQAPAGGTIAADGKSVVVSGEGTWSVDAATGEITFTPEAGFTADPTPISYTVDDATGLTSNEATVTIDYPQTAPVAENDSESGTSGSPVVVDVVGNDSDPENDLDPATVIITASPAGGTIAADGKSVVVSGEGTWSVDAATGEITFTPEAGFTADPTPISYTVDDATGLTSNEATVTIDYPQTAPVAENDSESGTSGSPVVVDVVGNDSDPENDLDPATVIITASPAGGTIATDGKSVVVSGEGTWSVDAATGEITFTPEAGFTADPTPISYTVDDATGLTSNEATVTINYPQAVNDTQTGTSGSPVVVAVVGNDGQADNLDPATVIITASPAGGTIAVDGKSVVVSGEGTWSVDAATGEITFTPEAGFTADPTPISYTVDDATGLTSNEATVTIDYPQTAPVAENDSESGTSGSPVVVDVVGNDSDPENDLDPATVIITQAPAGGTIAADGKSVVVPGEGTWSVDAATGEITFTPEAGFTADPTPISYTVDDATGLTSNEATVTINYPQAVNDTQTGTSGSPVVVAVVGNDGQADNLDPATVIITASPAGGTIAVDGKSVVVSGEGTWSVDAATGEITFTPEAGFTADPTPISYTVDDATGLTSNEATVTIDYPQTAPVAENDSESGTSGSPVVVDVVGNDSDPENDLDPATVIITQAPAGGTIAADGKSVVVSGEGTWSVDAATGEITFTPEAGFTADPTPISYTVDDATGLTSNEATVTINYPQAVNDTQTGTSGSPVVVAVVGNDGQADNLDPATVIITASPAGGTIAADGKSVVVSGEGTWSVDAATGEITFTPEAGFTADPTPISYTVDDVTGLTSNEATVTIDYPQTAPVAENDRGVGPLNTAVSVDILANDSDPEDDLDPTTVKLLDPTDGSEVTTVTVAGEGEWVVDPDTGIVTFTPEAGFTADPTPVDYVVSDITGEQSNLATIVVDYPPSAPVAVDDSESGISGSLVMVDILGNDTDLDGDLDPTTVKLLDPTDGSEVTTLTITGEGEWVVDPDTGIVTFTPEAGFTDDPTPVDYVVSDTTGLTSDPATVTIDYPQTAPVAENDSESGTSGSPVVVDVVGNDSDPENDLDPATVIITASPAGGTIAADGKSVVVSGEGTWSVDAATGEITFTPEAGFTADPTPISYTVDDATGLTSNEATVTIDYPQTAPVAENDSESGTSGSPVVVDVVGNDSDPENDLDPATVVITASPAGGTIAADGKSVVVPGEGTWSVDAATGEITFTPEAGFTADPTPISYTVDDATGLTSNEATVTINYPQAVNDTQTGTSGSPVVVAVVGNDGQADNLDPATVIITASPAGGTIAADGKSVVVSGEGTWSVDAATGEITFTPEAGFTADPTPISYTVDDATGLTSNEATVTIDYPQTAPVAENDSESGTSGSPVVVDVVGNDSDPENDLDPATVIITASPAGGTIATDGKSVVVPGEGTWSVDAATGEITFTPEAGFTADPTPISYTVDDATGLTSNEATVTINYPQAVNDTQTGTSGSPVVVAVVGNDGQADNLDPATVIITASPAGGTIAADGKSVVVSGEGTWSVDAATGEITFTPEAGFTADPTPISYTVDDATGLTSNEATVTIDYPQTAPVAENDSESGTSGSPVVVDVVGNDSDPENDLDPTTVIITQAPAGGTIAADGKSVVVSGEGTWSVDAATGEITFTPEAGFTADPTPISYTVDDATGLTSNEATVTINYPQAVNDTQTGTSGSPVVVAVVGNDGQADNLDPATVIITASPAGGTIAADGKSVVVSGEGTWSVDAATGEITFTPEAGFTADPTPISYTVDDVTGLTSNEATVTIDYPQTAPVAENDSESGTSGSPVVVDVVGNDSDPENDLDPTTVKLLDPADGSEVTTLTVTGEGVWSVDPITGEVTFTPEAGFTDDPTSVEYVVSDTTGLQADPATITVDYPQTVPDAVDDNQTGVSGAAVLVDVLDNDTDPENDIDPTTVKLLDPADGSEVTTLTVTGEGEWVVDPITGEVAFTPEIGFTDDPTPVEYVVSDTTGLQADPATITVDYPQTAPVAVDDEKLDQVLGDAITVAVVSNDTDVEGDLDPTTVIITASPAGGTIAADGKSVVVAGEGEWSVDTATGDITFTPEAGFTDNPTPISYTIEDTTGLLSNEATVTIDYDQLTRIEVEPPGRVSEEGLEGGNPDSDPDSTLDTTDSVTDTDGNWIRVTDTDTDLSNAVVNFVLPATDNGLTSQGNPVVFRIDSSTGDIVGEYEYTDSLGASQTQNVLTIALNGNKEAITDGYQFGYNVTLGAPVDHTQGDDIEGILSVDFGIEVYEDSSATNPLATSDELLAIIEDDSPAPQPVVWNIDVQQETVTITDLQTGFTDSLFTDPTRPVTVDEPSYLVAGSLNTAAGSSGDTIPLRDYGGTVGVLTAEQDATYQAADGNLYVDALDEAIYWGAPADATSSPAGYTTYENTDYQGNGSEVDFASNIDLGDFSHINFGVFPDVGVLLETKLDLNFNVDVNGNSESVAVEYEMKHNETPNNATAATYGLDPADYDDDYVQSDFIVIPDATQIIDIAGQQYQLDLTFVNQDPLVTIDSDRNKTFLKAYQNNNGTDDNGDGLIDQSNYSTLGKLINGFANTNSAAGVSYYDLNGNGTIGDVGDAQYVGNTTGGYRYTVIGNSNFAYMDLDRNLVSDGIDFDGDNIIDTVLDAAGNLDYVVFSTNGRRAEDTNGDGIIDKYDSDGDNIVDTDFALDDYNPALDDENTFVVNSLEGQENTYDLIGKLTPLNLLPVLDNNVVIEGKVAVGGDAVDYLTTSSTGIIWSGVSTTDSDTTIEVIDTDGDTTNYEFRTDYGVFVGYADGSYKFNTAENIANIVTAGVDDIDVFSFEYQDSDGDTASSTVTLNYNEYATPQSPDSIDDIPSRTTADNDYLVGTNQAETLEGGAGDDTLVGLSGADILSGSDGNDILIFDRNDVSIDGGENSDGSLDNDTLLINDTNIIASTDMSQVVNFETINLTNDTAQTLSISLSDVVDITDGNNQLFIKGDSVDTVNVSDMTKAATSDQAGYDLYQDSGNTASLYIQTAIDDNII